MSSYETIFSVWHKTLAYSNIFDYPLTQDELFTYALTNHVLNKAQFDRWVRKNRSILEKQYVHDGHYWAMAGREKLFVMRKQRNAISRKKIMVTKLLVGPFWLLPWITFIGVTGTTAAGNAIDTDDVDLYVITKKNRKWITRLILLSYFSLLQRRHHEHRKTTRTVFCVNHVVEEHALHDIHHDVYIANELARMRCIWSKNGTYGRILEQNKWVGEFMPHWFENVNKSVHTISTEEISNNIAINWLYFILTAPFRAPFVVLVWVGDVLETFGKRIQQNNLKNVLHIEKENELLVTHRKDNRYWILREFSESV